MRILATLLAPDGGRARVAGHDVAAEPRLVRRAIALAGQAATVDEDLTGRENLVLLARLSGLGRAAAKARAARLLAAFELEEAAARQVKAYSGGMRRRLDLAASLLARAEVYFLDEPTTGLVPASRAQVHQVIRALAADGATVLLKAQYLDEADQLAARIAVIDHGTVIAEGTPGQLKVATGAGTLRIRLAEPAQRPLARRTLAGLLRAPVHERADPVPLTATVPAARSGRPRADGRPPGRRANGLGAARLGGARRGVRPGHRLALWQAAVSAVGTGQTGYCTAGQDTPQGPASVRHLARHQVMGLASVFLLGMAVILIGLPAETSGAAHLVSIAFLAAHALIGLGLVIGTVPLLRAAARLGGLWRRRAITGAAAIAVGVVADILTLITKNNWWSYTMAVGFIAALLAYGGLLLPASATAHNGLPPSAPEGGSNPKG